MALSKITAASITDNTITNTQINSSAAIAKTKLAALDIVNADVNASAAIATTKVASYALPIIFAYSTTSQSISATTWTYVDIPTQVIDTHNRFDPTSVSYWQLLPGKYFMSATVDIECSVHNNLTAQYVRFTQDGTAINGSEVDQYMNHTGGDHFTSTSKHTAIIHNCQQANSNVMRLQTWANSGAGTLAIKRVQLSVIGLIE
jgi:hypothetical protein